MVFFSSTAALAALSASLWIAPAHAESFYSSGGPVLELNEKTYDSLIAKSNYTSVGPFPSFVS
jgi:hypothetical protein